jgi:hypothetical protein
VFFAVAEFFAEVRRTENDKGVILAIRKGSFKIATEIWTMSCGSITVNAGTIHTVDFIDDSRWAFVMENRGKSSFEENAFQRSSGQKYHINQRHAHKR